MKKLLLLFAALCCTAMMQAEIVHHAKCDPTYTTVGYAQECWEDTGTGKLYAEQGCTTELNRAMVVTYKKLRKDPVVNLEYWSDKNPALGFDDFVNISQNESETLGDCPFYWNAKVEYTQFGATVDVFGAAKFKALGTDIANARLKCFWNSNETTQSLTGRGDDGCYRLTIKIGDQVVYEKNEESRWADMPHVFEVPLPGLKTDDIVTFEMWKKQSYWSAGEYAACLEYTSINGGDPDAAAIKTDDKRKFKGTDDPELTYTVAPISLAEKVSEINLSRDAGEEPGFYTIHASLAEGANTDSEIFFYDGTFEIVDGVHHEKGDPYSDTGLVYIQDCWEETATGKYYADAYLKQELKSYGAIGYPKLPSNPITATDGFTVKESATYTIEESGTYWSVPFDWAAETTYGQGEYGTRSVEFTVTEPNLYNNARLAWYVSTGSGFSNGHRNYAVKINDQVVESHEQRLNETLGAGFFFVPLPAVNVGDKITFEFNWGAGYNTPTVAACLQYTCPSELYFMAQEAGSTVQLNKVGTPYDASLEYSTNTGKTWQPYTFGQTVTLASKGDRVYFRNASDDLAEGFSKGYMSDYYQFAMTGSIAAGGNVMSLLDKTCKSTALPDESVFCFANLFSGCTSLTTAPELPATQLVANCYYWMFNGCTGLTEAPALPATQLAANCYYWMFNGCTGLTEAPALPATTLSSGCYTAMFDNCTGLTEAPALPATTVEVTCYESMFRGCTSLTEAPELPAMTMESNCYREMFSGCTSLETAPALPATTLAQQCYFKMFYGCTSLTTAPELPATTVKDNCYESMFNGCTSLTAAPKLPATTLARSCYERMFYGCTKLNQVKVGFTNWGNMGDSYASDYRATSEWLSGVATTGIFVCPDALDKTKIGTSNIPEGWTIAFEAKANKDPDHEENYYSTFYSSKNAYEVPSGVTAYTGVVNATRDALQLTAITGGIIPAGEPVILKAAQSQVYLPYTTTETGTKSIDNILDGTDVAKTLDENDYALSLGQSGVGFYLWYGKTIGANKAYLTLGGSEAKAFTFQFDDRETTAIEQPTINGKQSSDTYNLNGVRVNDNYKGIVIKNGKKIYQK